MFNQFNVESLQLNYIPGPYCYNSIQNTLPFNSLRNEELEMESKNDSNQKSLIICRLLLAWLSSGGSSILTYRDSKAERLQVSIKFEAA